MAFTTVIPPAALASHLHDPDWAIVDCRFVLRDPPAGRTAYLAGHIRGAVYAHLDDDLSGPVTRGRTGRHPLPEVGALTELLSRWGVDRGTQVVAYDDSGGSMAVRLWWLLRWLGHDAVAVLDGGWQAWQAAGLPVESGEGGRARREFHPRPRLGMVAPASVVDRKRSDRGWKVLDARAADRYRGENETIDPVAGHIPGAIPAPYAENLDDRGRFLPKEALRARFERLLGDTPASRVVCYCGSGVTAAHDVLAIAHAGLGDALLYPGSWSEWITDPARPVATGDETKA